MGNWLYRDRMTILHLVNRLLSRECVVSSDFGLCALTGLSLRRTGVSELLWTVVMEICGIFWIMQLICLV